MAENLFSKSLDPNLQVRQQAEQAIHQEEEKYTRGATGWINYVGSLCLADNAAAVYLKNFVNTKWMNMYAPDRLFIKQNIVNWIVQSSPVIRNQHLETLKTLFKCENVDIISLSNLEGLLKTNLIPGTFILLEVCRYFQWKPRSERGPLDLILSKIFPTALSICKHKIATFTSEDQLAIKNIVKGFFFTIRFELCPLHMQMLGDWCQLSAELLFKPLEGMDPEIPGFKAKKWAAHFLTRLFARYGQKSAAKNQEEADFIYINLAPAIVQAYVELISQFVKQNDNFHSCHPLHPKFILPDKVQHEAIMALQYAIKYKDLWNILKPHLDSIIPNYLIPLLKLSQEDQDLWESDPIEYVHSRLSTWDDAVDVRSSATIFISELCEKRKLMIQPVFQLIQQLLKGSWFDQEVALTLMSALNYVLRRDAEYTATVESFTYDCIIPAMSSQVPMLKAKSFQVFSKFCQAEFKGFDHLQKAFTESCSCLQMNLPLSIYAALSISPLLRFPELQKLISPNIPQMMHKLLELTNVIDMDILTDIMEVIVELYPNDIVPYAVELSTSLMASFMRILKNCDVDQDLDFTSDKIMTAIGMMKTIQSLILSLENCPQVVFQIEQIACPVLSYVLENDFVDLFEEIFEFIDTVTFTTKSVSPLMWKFFFECFNRLKDTAADYLDHMIPCFDKFIQYGKQQILADPSVLENINSMVANLFGSQIMDADKIPGCLLIETVLLHLRGHIDGLIVNYIDMALFYLKNLDVAMQQHIRQTGNEIEYKIALIGILMNCIYYNPLISIPLLQEKQCFEVILLFMQQQDFKKLHDKKLVLLTTCTILTSGLYKEHCPRLFVFAVERLVNYQDTMQSSLYSYRKEEIK